MARLFNDAANDALYVNQAVAGYPFVVSIWLRRDASVECVPFCIVDKDSDAHNHIIQPQVDGTVRALSQDASGSSLAVTSTNITNGVWEHICALFVSATDRRILLNNAGKGTNAVSRTPQNLDRTAIGYWGRANPVHYFSGDIAEVAVWDLSDWAGATASDKADNFEKIIPSLAAAISPEAYPLGLVSYWNLIRGLNDKVGGYNLTANGTAVTVHPRIIVPWHSQPTKSAVTDVTIEPAVLALALTQQTPTVLDIKTVTPSALDLAVDILAPTVFDIKTVSPSALQLALTQQTPTIICSSVISPAALALALTLETPITINIHHPGSFDLALTLLAPQIIIDCTIEPSVLALALTQQTPLAYDIKTVLPSTLLLQTTFCTPDVLVYYVEIPNFMQTDLIDPYSGGAWLWLIEIAVSGYDTRRIARNTADVRYGLNNYAKFNLQIGEQMFSGDGSIPRVTLQVSQDVNRIIEDIVNATEGALGASVKLIRVCEKYLETPIAALEADYDNLASESDSEHVTFTLGIPNPLTQRIPLRIYSSSKCFLATPTLFKGPRCQYAGGDATCTGTYEDCHTKGNAVHWGGELGLDPSVLKV